MSALSVLHFNGSNGSTTFTDESGKTWSLTPGSAGTVISTTAKKYGTASLYVPFGAYALETADHSDFKKTAAFTVHCWVKPYYFGLTPASLGGNPLVIFQSANLTEGVVIQTISSGVIQATIYRSGGTSTSITGATNVWATDKFYHVAVVYDGTNLYLFIDGVSDATPVAASAPTYGATNYVRIGERTTGAGNAQYFWFNYIDEFIYEDTAVWTSGFTPPTYEYGGTPPPAANSKFLMFFN